MARPGDDASCSEPSARLPLALHFRRSEEHLEANMTGKIMAVGTLLIGLALGGLGGCGSDESDSSGSGDTSGGGTCENTCTDGSSCPNIVCNCNDGTPVNTTSCNNSCCEKAAAACPGSCSSHGGWSG
jgi:hypothetical protein